MSKSKEELATEYALSQPVDQDCPADLGKALNEFDYPETPLEHYWFNKGHTSNKVYQENDYLRAQISYLREFKKQALEVIGFYSREFNTNHEGAWIGGPLYKDKLHGNDMVNMSSFAVGGKRARSFLEKYGEK